MKADIEDRVTFLKRLANTEWLAYADRQRLLALAEPQADIERLIAKWQDSYGWDTSARSAYQQAADELSALLTLEPAGAEPPQDEEKP